MDSSEVGEDLPPKKIYNEAQMFNNQLMRKNRDRCICKDGWRTAKVGLIF